MRQLSTVLSVSLLSLVALSGCSKTASETKTETKTAAETTKPATASADVATATAPQTSIKIATEGAYKPFNYVDKDGKPAGFDIEVVNALCEQMKAQCDIVTQDWDGIIPGLVANKYDAIIAGMSITPERLQKVDFSEPYFKNSLVFIAKKDNAVDTAALSGKKLGAQGSTVAAQHLEDNFGSKNEIKTYKTQEDAYSDLKVGRIDIMLSDKVPAIDWLKTADGTKFDVKGAEIDINDQLGIAVRKGDALKAQFDAALAEIKTNGKYQAIYDVYFK